MNYRQSLIVALALCAGACVGEIEGAGNDPAPPGDDGTTHPPGMPTPTLDGMTPEEVLESPECQTPQPGRAPMRRLSNFEYKNAIEDLFSGVSGLDATIDDAVASFPAESESLGFRNSADLLTVGSLVAQKYLDAAEVVAAQAAQSSQILPCDPASAGETACARQFIQSFGERAYRRALTVDEIAKYEAIYQQGATGYTFQDGIEWVIFALLQSPNFLHRVELGVASTGAYTQPSPQEMAARLSFLVWQSLPDAELLAAAAAGELTTAEQLEAQARRMLADPKASRLFEYFSQWLDLDKIGDIQRDAVVFPALAPDLGGLLQSETRTFVKALFDAGGSYEELVTAPYTYANAELAAHYGLSGASASEFVKVDAPGRSGVLTQGSLLSHDKETRTSIVRRGLKVRTDLLCQIVPAPPPDVSVDLEGLGDGLSQSERLALHRAEPSCAGCHALMDPIGQAFESFDAVGRWRTVDELGKAIDTTAEISATRDMDGTVAGAAELGQKLALSQEARECYVLQNFRFFYGRDKVDADKCSLAQLYQAFDAGQHGLAELVVALTQTDAFRYRPVIVPEEP
ncbi:MAG TPA: DUF1592 domain-containing protein [Polyangiaceae bacterium]|nr:DUF1592 domain-containing protein [Polyangiaceae bacterium]